MEGLIAPILAHLESENPGDVAGLYLFGSTVSAEPQPDSDIDLLLITNRSLTIPERKDFVTLLLGISGWRGHAERFPEASDRRPIELTSLTIGDLGPWTRTPTRDFQYGEWLREKLVDGQLPAPAIDPDVITLVATAQASNRILKGPEIGDLTSPVPPELLRYAIRAVIPDILEEIDGDERNTLLALARILVTLDTGSIVSKQDAAVIIAPTLSGADRILLERARDGYLGKVTDDWADETSQVTALAHLLAERAREKPSS